MVQFKAWVDIPTVPPDEASSIKRDIVQDRLEPGNVGLQDDEEIKTFFSEYLKDDNDGEKKIKGPQTCKRRFKILGNRGPTQLVSHVTDHLFACYSWGNYNPFGKKDGGIELCYCTGKEKDIYYVDELNLMG